MRSSLALYDCCPLTANAVDGYFAPDALSGKDCNWIPTKAHGQFEMLFRFYGPEKPLFEKIQ